MKKTQKQSTKRNILTYSIAAAAAIILGVLLVLAGFNHSQDIVINYEEKSTVDYKVYLKKNKFFESPYLPAGKTYITSLIDHLDIDYNYNIEFDNQVSGNYSYYYVAVLSADRATNGAGTGSNYWSREYALTEPVSGSVNNSRNLSVSQNLKVDYDKYNKILADFKNTYALAANGTLKVVMRITGDVRDEHLEDPVSLNTELSLSVPLTEQSVEVSVSTEAQENRHSISSHIDHDNAGYITMRVVGIIAIVGAFVLAFLAYRQYLSTKADTRYEDQIKKILGAYDSVIVEVGEQPKLAGVNVLSVNNFDELLDVYNSIHLPISFYRDAKSANFIIIDEKMAWRYSLAAKDFRKKR